jgi:hypothetical protein
MGHITTWEEDYKGNNTSPSLQSPLANSSSPSYTLRLFEDRVIRRIFGPNRDEVRGEWRKLHNEDLRILYSSQIIIRQIKSRRLR